MNMNRTIMKHLDRIFIFSMALFDVLMVIDMVSNPYVINSRLPSSIVMFWVRLVMPLFYITLGLILVNIIIIFKNIFSNKTEGITKAIIVTSISFGLLYVVCLI